MFAQMVSLTLVDWFAFITGTLVHCVFSNGFFPTGADWFVVAAVIGKRQAARSQTGRGG